MIPNRSAQHEEILSSIVMQFGSSAPLASASVSSVLCAPTTMISHGRLRAHRGQGRAKSFRFIERRDHDGDERTLFHGLPRTDVAHLDVSKRRRAYSVCARLAR